jgi:hypothetical protein
MTNPTGVYHCFSKVIEVAHPSPLLGVFPAWQSKVIEVTLVFVIGCIVWTFLEYGSQLTGVLRATDVCVCVCVCVFWWLDCRT